MDELGLHNNVLDEIIYGTLDADIYKTCLTHEADLQKRTEGYIPGRQDKYYFPRLDMEQHFTMLRQTNDFQCRFHMSESAYKNLVDILEDDITVDEKRSMASTGGNDPISKVMIACMGLRFMGGEKYKSLADIWL